MTDLRLPTVDGIITGEQVQATVDAIAEWQLPSGMVPWVPGGHADPWIHVEADMALAKRIVEIEKPAHTVCDVRFYWAMNRVGEARIGSDTELGAGSRAPELIPPAILGQAYLGSGFVGGPQARVEYRERLAC